MTFGDGCIYQCQHPLWGGSGICEDASSSAAACSCDAGFFSSDSFGNPSCVRKLPLLLINIALATTGALTLIFQLFHAEKHRPLLGPTASRRSIIRLRLIWQSSLYALCRMVVFGIPAIRVLPLADSGTFELLFILVVPMATATAATMVEVWVESLPSQLLPVDSVATKLKDMVERRGIFHWARLIAMVGTSPFGVAMYFVSEAAGLIRMANIFTFFAAVTTMLCLMFVAIQLNFIIEQTAKKASPSSKVFYRQARKMLWIRVAPLCLACGLWATSAAIIELTEFAGGTPILPVALMLSSADTGYVLSTYFSDSTVGMSASFASPLVSPRAVLQGIRQLRGTVLVAEWSSRTQRAAAVASTARVLPTIQDEF